MTQVLRPVADRGLPHVVVQVLGSVVDQGCVAMRVRGPVVDQGLPHAVLQVLLGAVADQGLHVAMRVLRPMVDRGLPHVAMRVLRPVVNTRIIATRSCKFAGISGTPGAQGSKGGAQGVVNGADRVADTPAFSRSDATGGSSAPGARGANGGAQGVTNGADRVAETPAFSRTMSSGPMGTGQAADPNAPIVTAPAEQVYSFDGSGNNIRNSDLGAAGQEFIRIIPTATSDRLNDADLPSARG